LIGWQPEQAQAENAEIGAESRWAVRIVCAPPNKRQLRMANQVFTAFNEQL